MHVLLTNDDGVEAVGIACMAEALVARHEVTIVAPSHEQSGVSHAFTFKSPLHFRPIAPLNDCEAYAVDGTPSDCVKFAVAHILRDRRPDCIVSGMNIGENSGVSSIYSGTVAAAREGALWKIPSFAFSVAGATERFVSDYAAKAVAVLDMILGLEQGAFVRCRPRVFYNVNFPACAPSDCRGLRVTRQSLAFFDDHYRGAGADAVRGEAFMLFGEKRELEDSEDYDSRALIENWAVITPVGLDATDADTYERLRAADGIVSVLRSQG